VELMVMERAQQHETIEIGSAAGDPRFDMMDIAPSGRS